MKSKSVKEHLSAHENKALFRAGLFSVVVGLPLLFLSLKAISQRSADEVVEPQKSYINSLILSKNFPELQRAVNSLSFSQHIQRVELIDSQNKVIVESVPKVSKSVASGSTEEQLVAADGSIYRLKWQYQIPWSLIVVVFLTILFVALSIAVFVRSELFKIGKALSHPLELISSSFREISKVPNDLKVTSLAGTGFSEVDTLDQEFTELFQRLNLAEKRVIALAQQEALNKVAAQVAHDIRSPLSSLNIVAGEAALSEDKKAIFQSAITRINNIANDLLFSSKISNLDLAPVEIVSLVKEMILEKKTQHQKIHFATHIDANEKAFARVNAADFSRIISNLMNNAVESLIEGKGEITVGVRTYSESIAIIIQDNGCGMSAETVKKLGHESGFSVGKDLVTTGSGSGLGVYHAFSKVQEWGGKIDVVSKIGEGTVFNIQLTKEKTQP